MIPDQGNSNSQAGCAPTAGDDFSSLNTDALRAVEHTMRVFCVPGQVVSIQSLHGPGEAHSRCTSDLQRAAAVAVEMDAMTPKGVYFTLNPVGPKFENTKAFPKDSDITER